MPPALQSLSPAQAARLQQVFGLLQSGRAAEALPLARGVAEEAPGAVDAQHALALCLSAQGDLLPAERAFMRAVELAPGHAMVAGNYAKFLYRLGVDALRNGDAPRAVKALDRATRLQPGLGSAWHALGNALRATGDFEGAERALRQTVSLAPANGAAWVNLGVVLRLLGRPAEALPCIETARRTGLSGPELEDAEAGARIDVGEFGTALDAVRRLVAAHPDYVAGQVMLVHLLWEHGAVLAPGQDPFEHMRAAVERTPGQRQMELAYIGLLLETRKTGEALERLERLRRAADEPLLMVLAANAHEIDNRPELSGPLYERAHAFLGGSDPGFLNAYTRHLLKAGKWDAAAARAAEATRISPHDQEAWAYLGTAWRLLDDPREFWLCDYERLIDLVEVAPPPPFGSHEEFTTALEATLDPLHKARREPIQQSLRGGSQTPGKLFGRQDPVIAATQAALTRAIEGRIAALPDGPDHPFLQRKLRSVRYTGSWSVKLWSSGNHVNHIHPQGWMSSAFYVSLPPSVRDQQAPEDTSGYIQFGQPPVELGLDLPPRRVIRPRVGYLALFPSYMWHGTVPFEDTAPRITVAFDMVPLA